MLKKKALGTHEIGKICHVAPITVGRWLDDGLLPYSLTGGGHRRVAVDDLVAFLRDHNHPVPRSLTEPPPKTAILIVDDDATIRRFVRRAVEKILPEARIEEAGNGYDAGESVASMAPDLVILDIYLPGINGFEVCRRIRSNRSLTATKVLAVTGEVSEETRDRALKSGADDLLFKPFKLDDLQAAVLRLVGEN